MTIEHSDDLELLGAVPDFLSVSQMLKATPAEEAGRRFVYIEASNESVDQQGEVVLAKALSDSADYYLKFGNLDIDHVTMIGAKAGIPDYTLYEIGRPVDVRVKDGSTFVKGEIFAGTGDAAERANAFWSSLTDLSPPARWYPSVGGAVKAKAITLDPKTKEKRAVIKAVRWSNIGFSKTPVNPNLAPVASVPFGALAKSWGVAGFDIAKALEAGYGTDAAALTGGSALRRQSIHGGPGSRDDDALFNTFAELIRGSKDPISHPVLRQIAQDRLGFNPEQADRFVGRFLRGISQRGGNR